MLKKFISDNKKNNNNEIGADIASKRLIGADTRFDVKEAYNELRTNIMFSIPNAGSKVVAVTSSVTSEGKSTTCLNTAISFADIYGKAIIIDCDLRRPNINRLLGVKEKKGLSNILVNDCCLTDAIIKTKYKNLDAITAGNIPPNPTELLSSETMTDIVSQLKKDYKYIFLDTPPINIVIDASLLVKLVDGVVIVVRQQIAEKRMLQETVKKLNFANAKILGFVLNDVSVESKRYMKGKYGRYGYSHYTLDE
ncbi:MAG: CpsD/CapB family tyrosine-protein kinase [Clostridia bacterium]|nr:CpsD/CapB family tyrosine-protein kinase [Clostridia bacterium]